MKYARYVYIDKKNGSVMWYENPDNNFKESHPEGVVYDTETDDPEVIQRDLDEARRVMMNTEER